MIKYKILKILPWLKRIDKKLVSIPEVEAAAMEYDGLASEEIIYEEEQKINDDINALAFKTTIFILIKVQNITSAI